MPKAKKPQRKVLDTKEQLQLFSELMDLYHTLVRCLKRDVMTITHSNPNLLLVKGQVAIGKLNKRKAHQRQMLLMSVNFFNRSVPQLARIQLATHRALHTERITRKFKDADALLELIAVRGRSAELITTMSRYIAAVVTKLEKSGIKVNKPLLVIHQALSQYR
jgi:hypothetical protein